MDEIEGFNPMISGMIADDSDQELGLPSNSNVINPNTSSKATKKNMPTVCNICDENFSDFASLRQHKATHPKNDPHVCVKCKKTLKNRKSWQNHKKTHDEKKVKPKIVCPLCANVYFSKYNVQRHIKYIHNVPEDFDISNITVIRVIN